MISSSPSSASVGLDQQSPQKATFGRGVVGRHRFLNTNTAASESGSSRPVIMESASVADRPMSSMLGEPSSSKQQDRSVSVAQSVVDPSEDGMRSEVGEIPTLVAKLSTVQLNKRDSEATQTDLSRFASVQDFGGAQQQGQQQHSAPASLPEDWIVQTLSATDNGIPMLIKRAKQSMVSGKVGL